MQTSSVVVVHSSSSYSSGSYLVFGSQTVLEVGSHSTTSAPSSSYRVCWLHSLRIWRRFEICQLSLWPCSKVVILINLFPRGTSLDICSHHSGPSSQTSCFTVLHTSSSTYTQASCACTWCGCEPRAQADQGPNCSPVQYGLLGPDLLGFGQLGSGLLGPGQLDPDQFGFCQFGFGQLGPGLHCSSQLEPRPKTPCYQGGLLGPCRPKNIEFDPK